MQPIHSDLKAFYSGTDMSDGLAAIEKNNAANIAKQAGRYDEAVRLHVEAVRLKVRLYGADSVDAAFSYNMLGDALLAAGKLDKAAEALEFALKVRDDVAFGGMGLGPRIDAAASRDNMARVLEAKGDFPAARELRLKGADKGHVICGCLKCVTPGGALLSRAQLKACGACRSVFYCSTACQKRDWKERHKPLCKKHQAASSSSADAAGTAVPA
ncbi:hypothetical protein KVR01_000803 [Diaporthe batatas]|uniref:uncharacterized protein n=1 Tax=Diaporthe batatas TaxID=748121 RepID=UPI001D03DDC4|nr:uncharacterized protein KVR01_000803 [Diaporthe batatas]KAG8170058.1 hypothetical protein KVR01_000803 [Diaporthe batatas]